MQIVGQYNGWCFFKLRNGEDCFGEIEAVNDNFLQFNPDWEEALKDYDYERHYYERDEFDEENLQFILIPLEDVDITNLYYWNSKSLCFINLQWNIERKCWVRNETIPGSIPLPARLKKDIPEDDKRLKAVGFWQLDQYYPYYPHPKHLVERGWRENERVQIVAYLKAGHQCGSWYSYSCYSCCRFNCFSLESYDNLSEIEQIEVTKKLIEMGRDDLSDGEWFWPEGLAHYVEKHNVCLPDTFILTMQKNSWSVPQNIEFKHYSQPGVNESYWINWAIKYTETKQK